MKFGIQVITAAALALLSSCGNNEGDKTATADSTTTTTTAVTDNTTVSSVEVPATTRTSFETKYPQASNVRWEYHRPGVYDIEWDWSGWPTVDTADYVANFNWEGSDYWAWYDQDGNWVGSVSRVHNNSALPTAVNNTLNSQYKDYTVVTIDKENDKNRTAYEIDLEKGTDKVRILVDENGKILKKKTISGDTNTKEKMNPKDSAM
jgi:Protein of unknown function (DUF2874).